jgi:hypothetical protein
MGSSMWLLTFLQKLLLMGLALGGSPEVETEPWGDYDLGREGRRSILGL